MAIEPLTSRHNASVTSSKSVSKEGGTARSASLKPTSEQAADFKTITQEIKKALESGAASSVIDEARVERVKAALQNGSYEINAERIAEKLLQLDHRLPNST